MFTVTDDSDESAEDAVVVFEPDIDLLLDLLVDTEKKKMQLTIHTSYHIVIHCSKLSSCSNPNLEVTSFRLC
jgi:hypothetical protein